MAKSLIEMNPKALKLVQHYWKPANNAERWRDTSTALLGAASVSEYDLSLELFDLADVARTRSDLTNEVQL